MDVAQHHLLEAFWKRTDDVREVVLHNISARYKIEMRLGGGARGWTTAATPRRTGAAVTRR